MVIPLWTALVACSALLVLDYGVRALRIHLFVRGAGYPVRYGEVFVLNAFGDAAAAVTPLRLGGSAARVFGLARAGVPLRVVVPVLALEVLAYNAVVAVGAGFTAWLLFPAWWHEMGVRIVAGTRAAAPWIALVLALCLVALRVGRRMRGADRPVHSRTPLRGTLGWPLLASVPLTALSISSRVAVLPILALTLAERPGMAAVVVSSFLLIYGQLAMPTPGGLGGVEIAFASGMAGEDAGSIYLLWRTFVTITPIVLGFALGIPFYGAAAVRGVLRGRAAPVLEADTEPVA